MKRVIGSIFIVLSFIMFFMQIKGCIVKDYEYQNKIEYAWNLADKSSTLSEKSKYIEEFVTNIKKEKFAANNAVLFKTKDNSFVYNLLAVESLNKRLKEISKMDETSFAYQTAIQQITAQEQGEAGAESLSLIIEGDVNKNEKAKINKMYLYGACVSEFVYDIK